ncbi:MAG: fibrobacter succinogenes major paralogous domain-containing protein [Ferruginibacter sp.]
MSAKSAWINFILLKAIFLLPGFGSHAQTVEDSNKEIYKSIKIDKQVWMAENLNLGNFRNGDTIPEAKTNEEWISAGKEGKAAWCYYENKIDNGVSYGRLYNWYAVTDTHGLAPKGWHVPTDAEWRQVTLYLGGEDAAGTKMKTPAGWTLDGNGTNESGFSGLPGGSRNRNGEFDYTGHIAYWWCSTPYDPDFAWYRVIDESPYYVYRTYYYKQNGYSVRCIKDQGN